MDNATIARRVTLLAAHGASLAFLLQLTPTDRPEAAGIFGFLCVAGMSLAYFALGAMREETSWHYMAMELVSAVLFGLLIGVAAASLVGISPAQP